MVYTITNKSDAIEWGLAGDERIIQNVLNLLRTKMQEVPFMFDLGLDQDVLDNTSAYAQANLRDNITKMIERYEPRVKIRNVNIISYENGNVFYEVEVEV